MRYLELIAERPLIWGLFIAYLVATSVLAWIGHKKTDSLESFAVGRGDMSATVVGVTLAASIASTATFVINPGFVYVHGISALIHLAGAVGLGIGLGLIVMSGGFHDIGRKTRAVTLPGWIGARYGSRGLAALFALINLLSLCFVVLIIGGLSIVMQKTLGLTNTESLILVVGFVFGYVFIGGAYAHAYTNTLQGLLMVIIAAIIVGSGLHYFAGGFGAVADKLAAVDPNLVKAVNPDSALFGSTFSVYISGFVIGFALVCQPHIMTKALYVSDRRVVRRYLAVAIAIGTLFSALLLVGLYGHLAGIPSVPQDQVMTAYLTQTFGPTTLAVITVALMAAGMSTLDGILVALSSIAAGDLFLPVAERRWLANASAERRSRAAHRASQLVLIVLGATAFVIALSPPRLLGIFGQVGVYGIVAASAVPVLFGVLFPSFERRGALIACLGGLVIHFGLYVWGQLDAAAPVSLANPGVTATFGILASAGLALVAIAWARLRHRSGAAVMPALEPQR